MQRYDKPLDRSASTTTTWDIPKILSLALSGKLRVPNFQRSFVWDTKDVLRFFDSLYRGFPVGTLLVWQQPVKAQKTRFGPIEIDAPDDTEGLWIVDGQQRVTSIVATLSGLALQRDERFEVFFDLRRKRFVGSIRGGIPPHSLPVREALESRRLLAWLRDNADELEDEDLETADALGGALRDYKIPVYIVAEGDESLLRDVFDRVNSAGKPISRAQVFHALFAQGEEQGSPSNVVDKLAKRGFGRIDESKIVQSLLAIRGGDVQRDFHDEFIDKEDISYWYDRTERALDKVISFLEAEGVSHTLLLPSSFPIPVLATFFDLHQDPEEWVLRLLRVWLWRGWAHGFGRESGQTPALRRAIQLVNPKKGHPSMAPDSFAAVKSLLESIPNTPITRLKPNNFMTSNSNGRLFLLALSSLSPRHPDGTEMDIPHELESNGTAAIGQIVSGSRASVGNRAFWLRTWPNPLAISNDSVLESHAITHDAIAALEAGEFSKFISLRENYISEITQSFINSKIENEITIRPPLDSMIVWDPDE
ncbi:DUF262 domain-containing protein [Glutamicibacter mishrai]|uniref:DUF262 domain-containing protein n=1 Tax=Glutamicibacter mishrai TaxID=1775880 RepID=UPI0020CD6455|nr:DUF262 domain-containing protein [Glutamicibacter mishrai]UTT39444.1 DUF262 domain-containing protein [Glutamicibacter mishrai]